MFFTLLLVLSQNLPAAECRTSGMNVACGFHCRAELDEVKCAQTPQGLCTRLERQLVCWDPPEEVRLHFSGEAAPVCKTKYREVACGYACLTSPNRVACAQTPFGVCATRFDQVQCWDPSAAVLHHSSPQALRGAKCLQTDKTIACGYHCLRSYQDVACAQTPQGHCRIFEGRIVCFDPPVPAITHEAARSSQRADTQTTEDATDAERP